MHPVEVNMLARARNLACAMMALVLAAPASAQDYPNRAVTLLVPQAPGASSDALARTLLEPLQAAWGQPIVIDNRPGASSNIGAAVAARAQPDGYTILIGTDALMTSNAYLFKSMPFDPVKDFAPVTVAGLNTIALTVNAELPVTTVPELIAYAKANPGKLQYGTPGIASPHHLSGELLRRHAGVDIVHVPYRGGGPAANDLVGGHIKMAFLSLSTAVPILPTGKIRIVALVERHGYAAMPDVPTLGEILPGFEMSSWLGLFVPAATPAPIIARINETMRKILLDPPIKEKLATLGLAVAPGAPAELADRIKRGLALRGELIKAANIQPE
jgi:tripartite-type tricarboxylate transporter receptor subunit TctC